MDTELYEECVSRGISLMAAENYQQAKEWFKKALEIDIRSFDGYTHLGNACASLEQYDEALEAFKNALLLKPESGETLFSIANVYLLEDDRLSAVEYYNKAEAAGFVRAELYRVLAAIFLDADDIQQALRNITKAIAVEPLNGYLRLFKAQVYLSAEKYDEALETLDEMQKVLPDAFEAYDLRAQILCGQKKYDEALRVCEQGYDRFPGDANLAMSKLRVLMGMERDEDAAAWIAHMKESGLFEDVLKDAVMQEAVLFLRKQDAAQAISVLEEANAKLDNDPDIMYFVLHIYGRIENYEKVIEAADKLAETQPPALYDSAARYYRAHAMKKLGRVEEAQKQFKLMTSVIRRYTIRDPSFYEGYVFRLLCHTQLGEYEKALELADYMENLYPDRADSHAFRYYIYKTQGDMEKAAAEMAAAHAIDPTMQL